MSGSFAKHLGDVSGETSLAGGLKGVEKESLRIDEQGKLSQQAHPVSLGSALTNRYITTDFSEALLEFVTPAAQSTWETLQCLCDIHRFTYQNIGEEMLWVASMPCRIPSDPEIPLARYGQSNIGRMKTIYRNGLGIRYGRRMQTIAGVHFNYSLPTAFWPAYQKCLGNTDTESGFRSSRYLGLVRNFHRFGWLVLYLTGASPALCKSFADKQSLAIASMNDKTWYEPYATSLRMGDLGYNNQSQANINISLNSLDEYVYDLSAATRTAEPAYQKLGVKVNGEYRQLNANRLQIENEYYSSVRPKRVAKSGETPTAALRRGGIEYVEIRSLDLNVFDPAGLNQVTMRFMESFLIYCLLETSPEFDDAMLQEVHTNQLETARRGRDPTFRLQRNGRDATLPGWAEEILEKVGAVAAIIDREEGGNAYVESIAAMQAFIADPDKTPSARILADLATRKQSFFEFAIEASQGHRDYFKSLTPMPAARMQQFRQEVADSLERQHQLERDDQLTFDEFLRDYFAKDDTPATVAAN